MKTELLSQIKVLFADDDKDICHVMESFLSTICKEIICVNNGQEALDIYLEHGDFDILITDLKMPVMDGITLIKEIRKYDYNFPITITSAHSDSDYIYEAINQGVNGYVFKPVDFEVLTKRIEKVVEARILRKKLEEFNYDLISQLKERSYELNTILNTQENLVAVCDSQLIHTANSQFLNFFDSDKLDESNNKLSVLFDSFIQDKDYFYFEDSKDIAKCLNELLESNNEIYVKMLDIREKEHIFKLQISHYNYKGVHLVFSFTDITIIKTKADNYRHKASHDSLTSLHNRLYFNELLTNEISRAQRYGNNFVLVMFDIDHFKKINDTYGHDVGDEVLVNISQFIKSFLRSTDIFARWGGEEFLIFMPESTIQDTIGKINQLRSKIENLTLVEELSKQITVSFGITQFKEDDTKNSLLKRVDVALYNAKKNGRNRVESL